MSKADEAIMRMCERGWNQAQDLIALYDEAYEQGKKAQKEQDLAAVEESDLLGFSHQQVIDEIARRIRES